SARRSSATARGWSSIASNATQVLLDDRADLLGHLGGRPRRVDQPDALGLGPTDLEIPATHAPVERELLALEVVEAAFADAAVPFRGRQIEEQREVGQDTAGGMDVQLANEIEIDAAAVPLVGDGGVGVAITED